MVDYKELAAELLDAMKILHKAKPQMRIYNSLQGEAFVLHYISLRDGDVLPGEISCEMGVSTARIAAMLNKLEEKGLVTRQIDRQDRRKIQVRLTSEGKAFAMRYYENVLDVAIRMLSTLGEDDAKEYLRITKKMADSIR